MPVALLPVLTGRRKQVLVNSGRATGHLNLKARTAFGLCSLILLLTKKWRNILSIQGQTSIFGSSPLTSIKTHRKKNSLEFRLLHSYSPTTFKNPACQFQHFSAIFIDLLTCNSGKPGAKNAIMASKYESPNGV